MVKGEQGFVFRLTSSRTHWIGVRAEGYAPWEGWTTVGQEMEALTIVMNPGVRLTGKVKLPPESRGAARVVLNPLLPKSSGRLIDYRPPYARELAAQVSQVASDGTFAFERVRPDDYLLTISGKGIAKHEQPLRVADMPTSLGIIEVRGAGRIVGQVFNLPNLPADFGLFAGGEVYSLAASGLEQVGIRFKTDEDGRFETELPPGDHIVAIPYWYYDVGNAHTRVVRVIVGQTTEVSFSDPSKKNDLTLDFKIGNGSKEHFGSGTGMTAERKVDNVTTREPIFLVRLTPVTEMPSAFPAYDWHSLPKRGPAQIVLPDVSPGKYRVQIKDWPGSKTELHGDLYDSAVEVTTGQRSLQIPLAAGSVTGQVQSSNRYPSLFRVMAISENGMTLRSTCCDKNGNFCVRYLPEGRCTLYAQYRSVGWCRLGIVTVNKDSRDVGMHKLQPGGTLQGTIELGKGKPKPDAVVAIDAQGFKIDAHDYSPGSSSFRVTGLWPAQWTLNLMCGGSVLATTRVELKGTETAICTLTVR